MAGGRNGNEPKGSDFLQQRLKAWQPILTPKWVIISFLTVGIVFVVVGVVLKAASDGVVEMEIKYGGDGVSGVAEDCNIPDGGAEANCTLSFTLDEDMSGDILVYYELSNFFQNHRRYAKSRDDSQLADGKLIRESSLGDCDPLKTFTFNSSGFNEETYVRHPCGLIAASFFNDTYVDWTLNPSGANTALTVDETDISWESDRENKFKAVPEPRKNECGVNAADPLPPSCPGGDRYIFLDDMYPGIIDRATGVEDEHFIVWMRVAALPTFRKLWGRLRDADFKKGDVISVIANSRFPVLGFDGTKSLVLSTSSWLGGKNPFLGIAYIVVGSLCLALTVAFGAKHSISPRRPGDTKYLQWTPSGR